MKFSLTLLLIALHCSLCVAQQGDFIHIAKFKDNKDCAISYTFDDGLKEHATLVTPWLNKFGFKGTFVVNGSIINRDNNIKDTTRMTWGDLKKMASNGHEISNHGWAHRNFGKFTLDQIKEDITKNDSAIFSNIGIMPRTFAYPNNTKSTEGVKFATKNRVGTRLFQRSLGGKSTTIDLENWVNKLIKDKDWGVTMTHGITYGYDQFKSADILWEHLKKVKALEDQIWVGTFNQVSAYVHERDSTQLKIEQPNPGYFIVTPQCTLDKSLFTETLTGIFDANDIQKIEIRQGKNKLKTTMLASQVVFSFNPFGEAIDIKIQKKK